MILIGFIAFAILFISVIVYVNSPAGKTAVAKAQKEKKNHSPAKINKAHSLEYVGARQGGRTLPAYRAGNRNKR